MISADLHIHSCLSPCGDLEMGPETVLDKVREAHLDLFAIADHNSTRNCRAFVEYTQTQPDIRCIPAIEVTSAEEAHILCYFDVLEDAELFGSIIEESLLPIPLDEEKMGMQIVVNAEEEVIDMIDTYLSVSSSYSISEIVELAHTHHGVVVPAHIDKPIYSIVSQLGFVPDDPFDSIELSYGCLKRSETGSFSYKSILTSSDAHYPDDIGRAYFLTDCSIDDPIETILANVSEVVLR